MDTNLGYIEMGPSLKATLLGGHGQSFLRDLAPPAARHVEVDVDVDVDVDAPALAAVSATVVPGRGTVLPRRRGIDEAPALEMLPRFQHVRTLGEGAAGRVELVRDNDIRRTVAVKHLLTGTESPAALSRFADEIRVVGQLEHPGIVPIYDVDRDEDGQVYLVMKHLQGDTMEQVIERLRADDPAYVARFTPEYRVRIFLGVLDAMSYAHGHGVLHRDLKPANIMIGPYGEVTVVDWGIAKPLKRQKGEAAPATDPLARTLVASHDARLLETQMGTLAGTPLYMSPEQAGGRNDELDERSDVYSLCVVLYEWLVLQHPLRELQTIPELLATLILNDYTDAQLFEPGQRAGVPTEYLWIIRRGLLRDRDRRYQAVGELEDALKRVQDGHIPVQCNITWAKNKAQRFVHWIDRHPRLFTVLVRSARGLAATAAAGGVGFALWRFLA